MNKNKESYIARLTTQERPCFVCSKFTSVVLTSADNSNDNWFYTCRAHLGDFNFCSRVNNPSSSPKPTQKQKSTTEETLKDRKPESDSVVDLVSSIGLAFKSWRSNNKDDKKKEEEEEGKEKEKDKKEDKEKEGKEEEEKKGKENKDEIKNQSPTLEPQKQQQPRFILQRDYFYLRQREYVKKLQKKHAEQTLKTLDFPSVPTGKPTSK
ncbi:unnamed protein product [Cunninghamella blakesleeana]